MPVQQLPQGHTSRFLHHASQWIQGGLFHPHWSYNYELPIRHWGCTGGRAERSLNHPNTSRFPRHSSRAPSGGRVLLRLPCNDGHRHWDYRGGIRGYRNAPEPPSRFPHSSSQSRPDGHVRLHWRYRNAHPNSDYKGGTYFVSPVTRPLQAGQKS